MPDRGGVLVRHGANVIAEEAREPVFDEALRAIGERMSWVADDSPEDATVPAVQEATASVTEAANVTTRNNLSLNVGDALPPVPMPILPVDDRSAARLDTCWTVAGVGPLHQHQRTERLQPLPRPKTRLVYQHVRFA